MSFFESINQIVTEDANNSSVANLAAGATFTGTKTSTLGVAAIQFMFHADQNCTIYIDQSGDAAGTYWDVTDEFEFLYTLGGIGYTVQAVGAWLRVRVTNNGVGTTSELRLNTVLCPIVEALPRSLDEDGNLKVGLKSASDSYGFEAEYTHTGEARNAEPVRLIGTAFESTLDTNFWTTTLVGSGAVAVSGQATLTTGTTANSTVLLQTIRRARHITSTLNRYRGAIRLPDAGQANNVRRWGVYDANNGFFFQLSGTTFSVVTRKGGVDTAVDNGSFNGDLGATITLTTNYDTYEIYITARRVFFVLGDELIHTVQATTATIVNSTNLPVTYENNNSAGSVTNVTFYVLHGSVFRIGKLDSEGHYKNIVGAATTILKYGAGRLHRIIVNSTSTGSATVTVYDNTAASGTIIATLTLANNSMGSLEYGCPFFNGLTVVTTGAGNNITVVYE